MAKTSSRLTSGPRRIRHLDIVVLTHAHSDHMGGMPAILRNFRPRELWVGIDPDSAAYDALLKEAADSNITVRHLHSGDATDLDQLHITTLAPAPAYTNFGAPKNNDSVVLRLDYGLASALLEGDAEAPHRTRYTHREFCPPGHASEDRPPRQPHLHHAGSSSPPPLPVSPSSSVGRNNTFGHPRPEVITRIAAARTFLYRTDRFGLAQFLLTKDGNIQEIGEDGTVSRVGTSSTTVNASALHKGTSSAVP